MAYPPLPDQRHAEADGDAVDEAEAEPTAANPASAPDTTGTMVSSSTSGER